MLRGNYKNKNEIGKRMRILFVDVLQTHRLVFFLIVLSVFNYSTLKEEKKVE